MRVIVAYTEVAPGVLEALDSTGWPYELADVSEADDSYWSLLAGLWAGGETFVIVEHDVIVRPDTMAELAACGSVWCGHKTPYIHGDYAGMGCSKFGADMLRAVPDALDQVAVMTDSAHAAKHWCRVDAWLQSHVLPRAGFSQHLHEPSLGHYRPYSGPAKPSHGCIE